MKRQLYGFPALVSLIQLLMYSLQNYLTGQFLVFCLLFNNTPTNHVKNLNKWKTSAFKSKLEFSPNNHITWKTLAHQNRARDPQQEHYFAS